MTQTSFQMIWSSFCEENSAESQRFDPKVDDTAAERQKNERFRQLSTNDQFASMTWKPSNSRRKSFWRSHSTPETLRRDQIWVSLRSDLEMVSSKRFWSRKTSENELRREFDGFQVILADRTCRKLIIGAKLTKRLVFLTFCGCIIHFWIQPVSLDTVSFTKVPSIADNCFRALKHTKNTPIDEEMIFLESTSIISTPRTL